MQVQADLTADGCGLRMRTRVLLESGFLDIWRGTRSLPAGTALAAVEQSQGGNSEEEEGDETGAADGDRSDAAGKAPQTRGHNNEDHATALHDTLSSLEKGAEVDIVNAVAQTHQTRPPPRLSEARLVRTLEQHGVGRPSTYANIIHVLLDRCAKFCLCCLLVCLPAWLPSALISCQVPWRTGQSVPRHLIISLHLMSLHAPHLIRIPMVRHFLSMSMQRLRDNAGAFARANQQRPRPCRIPSPLLCFLGGPLLH
jgi:DNA topoisomerase